VLLVDGGSQDASRALAEQAGFIVLQAPRGRACQMNAGSAAANGNTLLFLHADSRLPADAVSLIAIAVDIENADWGRFDVRIDAPEATLKLVSFMINLRSRLSGIATGDQAIFVRRNTFVAMGGFPEQPLMEDIELCIRLKKLSRPACLSAKVSTSARRWHEHGIWPTIVLMWRLRWRYWRGESPEQLLQAYR